MTPEELVEIWKSDAEPKSPWFYLNGDSRYQKVRVINELKRVRPKTEQVDAAVDDFQQVGRGALFRKQHFILRSPGEIPKAKMVPILRAPAPKTYCVIVADEKAPDFEDEVKKRAEVLTLKKPDKKGWESWVRQRLKDEGLDMSALVIEAFLEETDEDEYARDSALKQVKATGYKNPTVSELLEVVTSEEHEAVWAIQQAIATNNWSKARKILREQTEAPAITAAIISIGWKLWSVLVMMQENVEWKEITASVPLFPNQWKKMVKGLENRHSAEGLRKLVVKVADIDRRVKRGKAEFWQEELLKAVAECTVGKR